MQVDWAGLTAFTTAVGVIILAVTQLIAKWAKDKHDLAVLQYNLAMAKRLDKSDDKADTLERHVKAVGEEVVKGNEVIDAVKEDVKKVEANSNGMRTALVDAEKEASLFRGQLLGMAQQKETGKEDAKDVREQIKDATATLAKVKVTGEDTKKTVEEVKEIVNNGNSDRGKP